MGITCQLVRLDPGELTAVRKQPIDVLGFIDWDQPTDRWADLDQAWLGLLAAFESQPRSDTLVQAILPGPPAFDESAAGGQTVTFADPELVRTVAGALTGLDGAVLDGAVLAGAAVDTGYVSPYLNELREFYRRAAAGRQAVAVIIG
jgi:hypothetical protein